MTATQAADVIRARVVALSGLTDADVLWEPVRDSTGKMMPRPSRPYITMREGSVVRMGQDGGALADSDTELVTRWGQRSLQISINWYGADVRDARNGLEALAFNFGSETTSEILRAANVGILEISDVRDLSLILDTEGEDRAQMDVEVSYFITATENQGVVENVSIEVTANRYPSDVSPIVTTVEVSSV